MLPPANNNRILWVIMGSLLGWGLLLATGTILFPGRLAIYRALLIFGCTFVFVAFWGVMLLWRAGKDRGKRPGSIKFPPPGF